MSDTDRLGVVRDAFDRRAATYDDSVMHRELATFVAEFVELADVQDVLDVATGTGLVLRALDRLQPGLRLKGVDISPGMLDIGRRLLPAATWVEADAAALPVSDRSVDLITCVTALHAIPDTRETFAEWRRVLRDGGRVVTATFAAEPPHRARAVQNPYPSDHVPFSSIERLTELAAATGFRITTTTAWSAADDALLIAEWAPAR